MHEPPPDNSPEPQVKAVVAAVIQRGDRFLICRRPEGKNHGGLWEFPGGKVDAGESFEDALRRELQEELAVEATHVGAVLFSVLDQKSGFKIQFIPTSVTGEPIALEHAELTWSTTPQLLSYPLAPSDRAFATFLITAAT
jgi:mutator protein MutT